MVRQGISAEQVRRLPLASRTPPTTVPERTVRRKTTLSNNGNVADATDGSKLQQLHPKVDPPVATESESAAHRDPIRFQMSSAGTSGKALAHAVNIIEQLLADGPVISKTGITQDPKNRWFNKSYGYKYDSDNYFEMLVIFHGDSSGAAFLAALIHQFRDVSGCRNIASGGEGIARAWVGDSFYTYVVHRQLPKPPHLRK